MYGAELTKLLVHKAGAASTRQNLNPPARQVGRGTNIARRGFTHGLVGAGWRFCQTLMLSIDMPLFP